MGWLRCRSTGAFGDDRHDFGLSCEPSSSARQSQLVDNVYIEAERSAIRNLLAGAKLCT